MSRRNGRDPLDHVCSVFVAIAAGGGHNAFFHDGE
jgi:hypothetical protein